jgi:hypothetical protein
VNVRKIIIGCLLGLAVMAQAPQTFKTRLSLVALDAAMKRNVTGQGTASATLAGSKLTVNGTFEGLATAATMAHIHEGSVTGVRGPRILELNIDKATSGKFSGIFDLKPEQVKNLQAGKWYVQIYSEKAPEGNLWGWLLK